MIFIVVILYTRFWKYYNTLCLKYNLVRLQLIIILLGNKKKKILTCLIWTVMLTHYTWIRACILSSMDTEYCTTKK